MIRIKKFLKIFIILILILFVSSSVVIAKDKDDKIKDKKDKKEKKDKIAKDIKEIIKDNKDKIENIRESGDINKSSSKLDSSFLLSSYIFTSSVSLENIQHDTNGFIKEIKQSETLDNNLVAEYNAGIKTKFDEISDYKDKINNLLQNNQKELIKKQNDVIKTSINSLGALINSFDKDAKISKETQFNKVKKIEDEVNKIYRQYRAIEWILFAQ